MRIWQWIQERFSREARAQRQMQKKVADQQWERISGLLRKAGFVSYYNISEKSEKWRGMTPWWWEDIRDQLEAERGCQFTCYSSISNDFAVLYVTLNDGSHSGIYKHDYTIRERKQEHGKKEI